MKKFVCRGLATCLAIILLVGVFSTPATAASYTADTLFTAFPRYLAYGKSDMYARMLMEDAEKIMQEKTDKSDAIASGIFTSIMEGEDIFIRDVGDIFGDIFGVDTLSTYDTYLLEATTNVVTRLCVVPEVIEPRNERMAQGLKLVIKAVNNSSKAMKCSDVVNLITYDELLLTKSEAAKLAKLLDSDGLGIWKVASTHGKSMCRQL